MEVGYLRNVSPRDELRIVTIDGPAGCGKSTVVRALAECLDGVAFSSGLVYRCVTHQALQAGLILPGRPPGPDFVDRGLTLISEQPVRVVLRSRDGARAEFRAEVGGDDPGAVLHSTEVTREVHWVADDARLRAALLPAQRELETDLVVFTEGRDTGSVVYPDAGLKVYMTATVEERARRRYEELIASGERASLEDVTEDVERRDAFDRERPIAPLTVPENAFHVDTTTLTVAEVVEKIRRAMPVKWRNEA